MQTRKLKSKWQLLGGLKAGGLEDRDSDEDFVKKSEVKTRRRKQRKRKATDEVGSVEVRQLSQSILHICDNENDDDDDDDDNDDDDD